MRVTMRWLGPDVVILSSDFENWLRKSYFKCEAKRLRSDALRKSPVLCLAGRPGCGVLLPSLSNARAQCVLTVFSETKSCAAISRLLNPRATSVRISSSRAVMPRVCWRAASGAKAGVRVSAGTSTSFTTTVSRMVSRRRVMRRPSQMPNAAKRIATSAP